jgi:putative phosphoesterase
VQHDGKAHETAKTCGFSAAMAAASRAGYRAGMTLAVIADIHGNLPALEAVLADIARRGVTRIVNLGDCLSGPLWPRETCEVLMARGYPTVRGNHDRWVATFAPADMYPSDRYTFNELNEAQRRWLGELPTSVRLDGNILGVHARSGHDDQHYLLEDIEQGRVVRAPVEKIAQRLDGTDAAVVLCGHSHQQHMVRVPGGPLVVNPGSVGLPAYRDPDGIAHVSEAGSPHARYALIGGDGAMAIELVALDYDHASAAKRAIANGSSGWAHALQTGFMPAPA